MITAFSPSCRPAPARSEEARSPNYRGPSRCCFLQQHATARNLCPRMFLASVTPATRCLRCPAVGRPGCTQPPCGRDRSRAGKSRRPRHPARLRPSSPQLAGHVNIRRTLSGARCYDPCEAPSGLAASSADSSRHRHPETLCRCPAHPWPVWGVSANDVSTIRVPVTSRFH